jgi:hypothetical protein
MSTTVTSGDSIAAFSNMLRCAFSTVSFLRGFCDAACFRDVLIGGMTFKRILSGPSEEAAKISEWIEGVIAAFKEGYLQQVTLQAFSQSPRRDLLEVYTFFVSQGSGGMPIIGAKGFHNCAATQTQKEVFCVSSQQVGFFAEDDAGVPSVTKETLRDVICTMLHDLVVALESMPVPDTHRCIGMRILYNDDVTPPDYEPPHFAPVSRQQVLSEIARERHLSIARQCDGASGFHKVNMGVLYQAPVDESGDVITSQDVCTAEFEEDDEVIPGSSERSSSSVNKHNVFATVLGCPSER